MAYTTAVFPYGRDSLKQPAIPTFINLSETKCIEIVDWSDSCQQAIRHSRSCRSRPASMQPLKPAAKPSGSGAEVTAMTSDQLRTSSITTVKVLSHRIRHGTVRPVPRDAARHVTARQSPRSHWNFPYALHCTAATPHKLQGYYTESDQIST